MIPTPEDLEKLKTAAIFENRLEDYVYLREDSQGRYIEYAFKEGAPHDNRCLSWYDKPQPNAYKRNNTYNLCRRQVDEIYRLREYACDNQNEVGDNRCCAGHPKKECLLEGHARHWTYDEPTKCACWVLQEPTIPTSVSIPIELALKIVSQDE